MTTMSESRVRFHFLSLHLLCFFFSSSFAGTKTNTNDHVLGLGACRSHQIHTLMQFKNEFDSSGCNQTDYFHEVGCDNTTGAITKLQLPSGCLTGTLKPNSSLFGFHHLRYLNLSHNNFNSSELPSEFGNLNKLEILSLSSSGFLGQVPSSFSNLSMLSQLDLSYNKLTGNFPLLQNISKLSFLKLSHNNFYGTLNPKSSLFGMNHLRYLYLAFNNFSSKLPSQFGNLNKLEVLSLSYNGFFGEVPLTFSNLTSLTTLNLGQNELNGSFPTVQNITKLSFLQLSDNHFSGTIPFSLLTMPYLYYLDLTNNDLKGRIEVSNSSRLELLYLGNNQFEGKILEPISKLINLMSLELSFLNTSYPFDLSFFSSLKKLWYLVLSGNSISPTSLKSDSNIPPSMKTLTMMFCGITEFPNFLKSLPYLDFIDISSNSIQGSIPEWLWKLPRLNVVSIWNNSFTGFEGSDKSLVNSSVQFLDVSFNKFEGTFPSLPLSIKSFSADGNSFTGKIPLSICNRSFLKTMSLSSNNFTGPIPPCFSNFMFLNLRKNNLDGTLPNNIVYEDAPLQVLDVGHNQLTGKLPMSLLNCSSLEVLIIDNNSIEDTFPFWMKALPSLRVLILRSNKFFGGISPPRQDPLGFPELRIFEIADNKFTGSLPPNYFVDWKETSLMMNEDVGIYMEHNQIPYGANFELGYMVTIDLRYKGLSMEQQRLLYAYSTIDFSGNKFEGKIPESIGLLMALIALNLSNNAFTGHIPESLANLKELQSLDLSKNQLIGTIPNGIKTLSFMAYMNVSHNKLNGEIPQGTQITGQAKSSFEGNAGLCGLPLEETCFGTSTPPIKQQKQDDEEEKVFNWKAVAIGYAPGMLFGLAISQLIASYKPMWFASIISLNKRRNN